MAQEKLKIEIPTGDTGPYACSSCDRNTAHTVLTRVKTFDEIYEGEARILFWNEYLTIRCNGCGTIGFCHVSMNSENEDYDENGYPFPAQNRRSYPEAPGPEGPPPETFADLARLSDIESLPKGLHDTARLIQMLYELNRAYAAHSYMSCIYLIRAILDHVPPILGFASFNEVANNYAGGGRSFRESMQHLQSASRKIADANLHSPIRSVETIPNRTQVEFRADMDVLLSEVVRVLQLKP